MKNWKSIIVAVAVLAFAGVSVAQPTIGVYFDAEGTDLNGFAGPLPDAATGYVMIKDANMLVGGAAFALDIDPSLTYFWSPLTSEGLYVGDENGVEIGLYNFTPVFDPADFCLVATLSFFSETQVVSAPVSVEKHPNYDYPVVANNEGMQYEATGLDSYLTLHATPTIGVYFDADGTLDALETNGGTGVIHEAWILVKDAQMLVGGATFKLEVDPLIMIGSAIHPPALVLGSLTTGVEMGLYDYIPVFGSDAGVLYELALMTFDNVMEDAPLTITNHPSYANPIAADNNAYQFDAIGETGYLTIVVPTDPMAWGEVKNLYR